MAGMYGLRAYRGCVIPSSSTNQIKAISVYEDRSRRWDWAAMPFTLFPPPLPFRWMSIGCVIRYWRTGGQVYGLSVLWQLSAPSRLEQLIRLTISLTCAQSKDSGCTLMEP